MVDEAPQKCEKACCGTMQEPEEASIETDAWHSCTARIDRIGGMSPADYPLIRQIVYHETMVSCMLKRQRCSVSDLHAKHA